MAALASPDAPVTAPRPLVAGFCSMARKPPLPWKALLAAPEAVSPES
jgi:hypothetical protein